MSSDRALRHEIERWVEGAAPPAPWLEQQVIAAVRARAETGHRTGSGPQHDFGALGGFSSGVRLAAGLVALLIALGTVAALLLSARGHNPTGPAGRSTTVHTPLRIRTIPFTPSPAVRAWNWPPGGPVPAQLAGSWQPPLSAQICRAAGSSGCILYLGAHTFQIGDEHPDDATNQGTIGPPLFGNVVVNGSEIDFTSDICTVNGDFGFERFTYMLIGNILVITRAQGAGQSNCRWELGPSLWPSLAGTYSRVASP
jgi:hypothetical protein